MDIDEILAFSIELNRTGTLPPSGNSNASPSLFTHAKSAQSVNHDINTRDLTSRHACSTEYYTEVYLHCFLRKLYSRITFTQKKTINGDGQWRWTSV